MSMIKSRGRGKPARQAAYPYVFGLIPSRVPLALIALPFSVPDSCRIGGPQHGCVTPPAPGGGKRALTMDRTVAAVARGRRPPCATPPIGWAPSSQHAQQRRRSWETRRQCPQRSDTFPRCRHNVWARMALQLRTRAVPSPPHPATAPRSALVPVSGRTDGRLLRIVRSISASARAGGVTVRKIGLCTQPPGKDPADVQVVD
jgi:hypothetical protein